MIEKLIYGLFYLQILLLVVGASAENLVMKAIKRTRAERGYQVRGTGWRRTFGKLFPPPPQEGDPEKLRHMYKIGSTCTWVGSVGMALMLLIGLVLIRV